MYTQIGYVNVCRSVGLSHSLMISKHPLNSFLLQRNFYQFYDRDGGKQKKRCDARAICDKGIKMSGHDVCIQKWSIIMQHPFLTETELYGSFEIE